MPDLNPEILKLDSGDMSVGIADVDGFLVAVHKETAHTVVGVFSRVVGRRSVGGLGPGIDPVAVSEQRHLRTGFGEEQEISGPV